MSVSGEFQRYLATALEVLSQPLDTDNLGSDLTRLRAELESAQLTPDTPLIECATRAIRALDLFWSKKTDCANFAALLPALRASGDDLVAISQIVVGQTGPSADRNSTTQES
jgi:hypothetical protein